MPRTSSAGKGAKEPQGSPPEATKELVAPRSRCRDCCSRIIYLAVGAALGATASVFVPVGLPAAGVPNIDAEASKSVTKAVEKAKADAEAKLSKVEARCQADLANLQKSLTASAEQARTASKKLEACEEQAPKATALAVNASTAKIRAQYEAQISNMQKSTNKSAEQAKAVAKATDVSDAETSSVKTRLEAELAKLRKQLNASAAQARAASKNLDSCEERAATAQQKATSEQASGLKKTASDCSKQLDVAAKKLKSCEERTSKARDKGLSGQASGVEKAAGDCSKQLDAASKKLQTCENAKSKAAEAADVAINAAESKRFKAETELEDASTKLHAALNSADTKCKPTTRQASKVVAQGPPPKEERTSGAWSVANDTLAVPISVLSMHPNHTIRIPAGTHRIFLEVGPNSRSTVDEEQLQQFDDAFLISFEPMLHEYAALLARKAKADDLRPLGEHHTRGIVLPFALAPTEGTAELITAGSRDSCASLLQPLKPRARNLQCANPELPKDLRRVPAVRLETVLKWLSWRPSGGWPIDYLKLDARGLDLEVLRSAGEQLSRVLRVQLYVPGDACERMYNGSSTCSETVAAMRALGYNVAYNRSCSNFEGECYEEAWEFVRAGIKPLHHRKLAWGRECWHSDLATQRDACCEKLHQGMLRGCFDHEYTVHRCCAHRWFPEAKAEPDFV